MTTNARNRPRALVVYESMWGNTERVGRAVADGLAESMDVEVTDVGARPATPSDDVQLVVAGAPTHAFSMSRGRTRADARAQGATQGAVDAGLREWLDALPSGHHPQCVATFDTRVGKGRHLPGSAARSAARVLRHHGYDTVTAQSFWVHGSDGPLRDGELERAEAWGRDLAAQVRSADG